MTTETVYRPGLQMFLEANRFNLILKIPDEAQQRASQYFNKLVFTDESRTFVDIEKTPPVILGGKPLTYVGPVIHDRTGKIIDGRFEFRYGGQKLVLFLTKAKNGGQDYYFCSLDSANNRARPRTVLEALTAIRAQAQQQPEPAVDEYNRRMLEDYEAHSIEHEAWKAEQAAKTDFSDEIPF